MKKEKLFYIDEDIYEKLKHEFDASFIINELLKEFYRKKEDQYAK